MTGYRSIGDVASDMKLLWEALGDVNGRVSKLQDHPADITREDKLRMNAVALAVEFYTTRQGYKVHPDITTDAVIEMAVRFERFLLGPQTVDSGGVTFDIEVEDET